MTFWLDEKRQLVLYPGQPGVLAQYIPELKTINGNYFAVPNNLASLQVMRWYQYEVPEVINEQNYDWPAEPGRKPWAHQRTMTNFMALHRRCFVLSDMGTGKTNSVLWTADYLMKQHPKGEFR